MSKQLKRFAERILAGQPINLPRFIQALPPGVSADWLRSEKRATRHWQVVPTPEFRLQLMNWAQTATTRVAAAQQGHSHRVPTSQRYLLSFEPHSAYQRPGVVCVSDDAPLAPVAVVLENQELFSNAKTLLPWMGLGPEAQVLWGQGAVVADRRVKHYLAQFDRVIAFFDFDLAGLRLYQALCQTMAVEFFVPANLDSRHFRRDPGSSTQLVDAIGLATELELPQLADQFLQTQKFSEQEVFLDECQ